MNVPIASLISELSPEQETGKAAGNEILWTYSACGNDFRA
jgi:hypothetical protein